ncbi:uncharacterized protein LOC123296198 [Chrysoperla carnea]|uniref:uncharacterized protein LOC123296198 n=1 Tax=Chrysoperla carnea TaxID=189513 RepID=UPI001D061596|nr:uncharacterized protein LOC123296198 [Chrysoperla carnea]
MSCIPQCSSELDGISKSDLDRFTDSIENLLSNEAGRRLFRHFLTKCKFKNGKRVLDTYEKIIAQLNNDSKTITSDIVCDILDDIDRIDAFDFAVAEKMGLAIEAGANSEDLKTDLALARNECVKILRHDYEIFRKHYSKKSS